MSEEVTGGRLSGGQPLSGDGERIVCIIARDVLPLDRSEADAHEFMKVVWGARWLILAFIAGFGLLSLAYALLATEWYQAEVVVTPTGSKDRQGLASALGNLSGGLGALAGIAGISLGATTTAEPIGVLRSHQFAREFIEDQGLLHVLLDSKWDEKAGRWKERDPRKQPDIRDAVRYFEKRVLKVQEDKKTSLVTVDVEWKHPEAAAAWANMLVDRLNETMRSRALVEAQANVDYLRSQLAQADQVAVEQAISKLLESELQKVMVARGAKQFAFRVVDPAEVPKWRSSPKRTLSVTLGLLAGGLVGVAAAFARQSLGRDRRVPVI
jgi:uncharacterized protein involved in exopolysaccharide biosynthesis